MYQRFFCIPLPVIRRIEMMKAFNLSAHVDAPQPQMTEAPLFALHVCLTAMAILSGGGLLFVRMRNRATIRRQAKDVSDFESLRNGDCDQYITSDDHVMQLADGLAQWFDEYRQLHRSSGRLDSQQTPSEAFGCRLRDLRMKRGLGVNALAQVLHVSPYSVVLLEHGLLSHSQLNKRLLRKLGELFGESHIAAGQLPAD